jgi:pimeloyl-ACP methyl ester carboxylesterase
MLILGEKDNHIPFKDMKSKVEINQLGEMNVLEKSGHIGFIEEPEKSAEMIKAFVQKCSGK